MDGVWFNGKTPLAVGGCILYHVLVDTCAHCEENMKAMKYPGGTLLLGKFMDRVRNGRESFITELRVKFSTPQVIQVCSDVIAERHLQI